MPTPYEFDKYVKALSQTDWYYDYSNDHGVWLAGNTAMATLQRQANEHKYFKDAFDAWTECIYGGRNTPEAVTIRKENIDSIRACIAKETLTT